MSTALIDQTLVALERGHKLFAGTPVDPGVGPGGASSRADRITQATSAGGLPAGAGAQSQSVVADLRGGARADTELGRIVAAAHRSHADAASATRVILDAARADRVTAGDTPMGQREAALRMIARLRAQQGHVVRSRAQQRALALRLRRLLYLRRQQQLAGGGVVADANVGGNGRAAVLAAIRKALDIKGIHDPAARARWTRGMDLVAKRESGYNKDAVNNWDSNAAKGTPSRGAWQFIAPTFRSYYEPGTSPNQSNLVSQAAAFINYARGRYGVLADGSNLAARIQQADPTRGPRGY